MDRADRDRADRDRGAAGRRPGRPRQTEAGDTKSELRRAALKLFARQGYAGTSIRGIAREVGLSESVLYAHFDSKQAIFEAVLADLGPASSAEVMERLGSQLDGAGRPSHYLRELVRGFLDEWDTPDARQLISLMARDGLLHRPALREGLLAMRAAVARLFQGWIDGGLVLAGLGSAQDLALSFTGPIGLIRILHLHSDATDQERATAREEILRHVDTFTGAVFPAGRQEPDVRR